MTRALTAFERACVDDAIAERFAAIDARIDMLVRGSEFEGTIAKLRALATQAASVPKIATWIESNVAYGRPPETTPASPEFNALVFAYRSWDRDAMLDVTASHVDGAERTQVPNMIVETAVQHDPAEADNKIYKAANQLATNRTVTLSVSDLKATSAEIYWALHLAVFGRAMRECAATLARSTAFLRHVKKYPFDFIGVWQEQIGSPQDRAHWTLQRLDAAPIAVE